MLNLYIFDRELRLLIMDAIERLEVSIRAQWAHYLAHTYGPHAYLEQPIFKDPGAYQRCLDKLKDELDRSKEVFVTHYHNTYTDPALPPIWVVAEVISLGQLSRWVAELKHGRDRQGIARCYGVDETVLTSFLHHLTIVRNICAHHGRLWSRRLSFQIKIPRRPEQLYRSMNHQEPRLLYNTLVMLEYFMNIISPDHHWKNRLLDLLHKHPVANVLAMGFPDDWQGRPIWRASPQ